MKLLDKLFKRKETVTIAASLPELSVDEQNAVHKINALRNSPAQILGTPFRSMTPDEFKQAMALTMAQVHCGPGYRDDLVDYALKEK